MLPITASLALLLAAAPAAIPAGTPVAADAIALARKVQGFYETTRDLRARFVQTYTYASLGRRQVSKGALEVKKPGKMRWDYESPTAKTIVVNGSRLVQWEPEANQAFVDEKFDATAMSAAVTFGEGGTLVLRPRKADPRVETVTLTAGPDGEVTRTRVVDGQGNSNDIAFEAIQRNPGIPDARFVLELPSGVRRLAMPGK
jgi:outer membrane lipoprotein carrier protein